MIYWMPMIIPVSGVAKTRKLATFPEDCNSENSSIHKIII